MNEENTMDFPDCTESLLEGKKLRRLEWPDDGTYVVMSQEKLVIFTPKDQSLHPLVISTGDMSGTDWVVLSKGN